MTAESPSFGYETQDRTLVAMFDGQAYMKQGAGVWERLPSPLDYWLWRVMVDCDVEINKEEL